MKVLLGSSKNAAQDCFRLFFAHEAMCVLSDGKNMAAFDFVWGAYYDDYVVHYMRLRSIPWPRLPVIR